VSGETTPVERPVSRQLRRIEVNVDRLTPLKR
jgi:hypothetical protein